MSEFKTGAPAETEAQFRQFLAYLFKQTSTGVVIDGVIDPVGDGWPLRVQQTATASASVDVFGGMAVVQDTILNGVSPLVNNATKTLDILVANPMGATPRNDIVVFDAATTSIRNIVGTPNAVPTDPTVPATAVALARLRHAASATTVPAAKIDDVRVITSLAPSSSRTDALTQTSGSPKRVHVGTSVGLTTNSTGFATLTHGAPFTPRVIQVINTNPTSFFGIQWGVESITSTTASVRWADPSGTSLVSQGTGPFTFICWE